MAFSAIIKPTDYFNTKLYTGTDNSNAITGLNFQPDFTWIKMRSSTASHALQDAVRGNDKTFRTNNTNAQYTNSFFSSFNSDGFTVATSETDANADGSTYASWNWKANGAGSSNTDGSITSTVSVNTTSGFSISTASMNASGTWTVGHGLGVAPKVVLVKATGATSDWWMWHESLGGGGKYIKLNTTGTSGNDSTVWNNAVPTSSVFSMGSNTWSQNTTFVAYCFADVQGFSKFGSYTGLGATTGAFVYTGFKPSFVMTKIATTGGSDTGGWVMVDNKSYPNNLANSPVLFANLNNAQSDAYNAEFFSNGFSFNANSVTVNGAGNTYIYLAFAETPFVANSGQSIPTTAR